jgi:hypothetical protein
MSYNVYSWNAACSVLARSDHNRPSRMCLTLFLQRHSIVKVFHKFVLGLVMLITLEQYIKVNWLEMWWMSHIWLTCFAKNAINCISSEFVSDTCSVSTASMWCRHITSYNWWWRQQLPETIGLNSEIVGGHPKIFSHYCGS